MVRKKSGWFEGQGFWAAVFLSHPLFIYQTALRNDGPMMGFDGICCNVCMVSDGILFQAVLNSAGSKVSHALAML